MTATCFRILIGAVVFCLLLSCSGGGKPPIASPESGGAPLLLSAEQPRQAAPAHETTLDEALAELDALATPEGVDTSVFAELKEALREALLETVGARHAVPLRTLTPAKLVSKPPTGESNKVTDLELVDDGDGSYTLTWSYRNAGDYNQDCIVNIQDITPLAVHFNETADASNEWTDGNGDTAINISDITPLAANFFTDCAGYRIQRGASHGGAFTSFMEVLLAQAEGDGRRSFAHSLSSVSQPYLRVVPYDGQGIEGEPSNVVLFPGQPPEIASVSPTSGLEGESVQFSAEVEGMSPLTYAWDFGGGASPNLSSQAKPTVTLSAVGEYEASVTVSNVYGSDDFTFALAVEPAPPDILSVSPTEGMGHSLVQFTAEVTGTEPLTYAWDFGGGADPNTSDEASPSTMLGDEGVFAASLTVTNECSEDEHPFVLNVGYARDWYVAYNERWPDGFSCSPNLGWGESYVIRSFISMYRASVARGEPAVEQRKWIDWMVTHCDYIVDDEVREFSLVQDGHGFTPIARAVKLIFKDDALYAQYKDNANKWLFYLEDVIVAYWRDYPFWETPHNWYLSYGSMLMNLHEISRLPYYQPPHYQTPDPSLVDYYSDTIIDMAENYFQDFGDWEFTEAGWSNVPFPEKKGLCYVPSLDAYIWRYFDHTGELTVWRYTSTYRVGFAAGTCKQTEVDHWYRIVVTYVGETLTIQLYDSDGTTLLSENTTTGVAFATDDDLVMGKRPNGQAYFKGILDEVKIEKGAATLAYWEMEENLDDSSGNGRNGTPNGTLEYVQGKVNQGLRFSGDDYVTVPSDAELDEFTKIDLWVKFDELDTARYYILGKGYDFHNGPGGYHIFMDCYKRPEDGGHANLDIEFVNKAAHDYLFADSYPQATIDRICNTFTKVLWENGDVLHPSFFTHLDASYDYGDSNGGINAPIRWIWLYEYDPTIGVVTNNWCENHYDDMAAGWCPEPYANLACWQAGLFIDDYETPGG